MYSLKIKADENSGDVTIVEHHWLSGITTLCLSIAGLYLLSIGRIPETTALLFASQILAFLALTVFGISLLSNCSQVSANNINNHITKESNFESWDFSLNEVKTLAIQKKHIGSTSYWTVFLCACNGDRKVIASSKEAKKIKDITSTLQETFSMHAVGISSAGQELPWEAIQGQLLEDQAVRNSISLETRFALGVLTMALLYFIAPAPVKENTPSFIKKRATQNVHLELPTN